MSIKLKSFLITALLLTSAIARAEVPVEDISQNTAQENSAVQTSNTAIPASNTAPQTYYQPQDPMPSRSLTEEQRLARLENQMQNLVQMNLPQQMTELHHVVQEIEGRLERGAACIKYSG